MFNTKSYTVNVDRDQILLSEVQEISRDEIELGENDTTVELGSDCYQLNNVAIDDFELDRDKSNACLDIDKLRFPLKFRKWKEGDVFVPFGMRGRKKVSDFLIDEKIPRILKHNIWVMESQGEICWIVGQRLDHRFSVNEKTQTVLYLKKNKC